MIKLDHLAISTMTLRDGVAHVEDTLGVSLAPGGEHAAMGTHNRLLSLGPDIYLEVIAINPAAPHPGRPRWFDLDNFAGPPRLTNWVAQTDDLNGALALAPNGRGTPMALKRGDLSWRMAVPEDGKLPFDGAFPALIEWQGHAHPAARLPDQGCRLVALEITHPRADNLREALGTVMENIDLTVLQGAAKSIRAEITTPHGARILT